MKKYAWKIYIRQRYLSNIFTQQNCTGRGGGGGSKKGLKSLLLLNVEMFQ